MTSPTRLTPLRRDAAANRERLIEAATAVFNDDGLEAGVEDIAARAGVGIGTLYRCFPTKEALIDHLVGEVRADMVAAAEAARATPGGGGLEHYIRATADVMFRYRGCLSRLWNRDHPPQRDLVVGHVAELLHEAHTAGAVRTDVEVGDVLNVMRSLRGVVESSGNEAARACQRHLDFVFAGMRPD